MTAALLLLMVAAAPLEPSAPPKVFALVVGNNRSADASTPDLKYADDDALALHRLLLEAGARTILLVRPDAETSALHPEAANGIAPSPAALALAWEQLRAELAAAQKTGQATEFLFFFSGHGDISFGEGFLALEEGRLTRSALQAMLAASPARRNHVIVDACKAYFAVMGKGPGGTRAPYPAPFAGPKDQSERSGFLLSTSSDGDSHEWERFQAGVFSFEIRSALRGSADVNGDGVVTYGELGGFLTRANAGITNARLRPDFLVAPPGGARGLDEPVLRWPRESASLVLDGAPGHLYVEASGGDRLLELNRGSSSPFLLHLPRERPLFVRSADEREERVLESAERATFSLLPATQPVLSRKGALAVAFTTLFASPFDESAVVAFGREYPVEVQRAPASWRRTLRTVSPIVAGGATAAGLVALGVGLERSRVTGETSQQERIARNEGIVAANVVLGVSAGVTAAALGAWLLSWTNEPATQQVEVALGPGGISVSGRW